MQFKFDDGVYKVARITGPQHNFLGIRLSDVGGEINIEALPMKNSESHRIEQDVVLAQVIEGLREINEKLGKSYFISQVFFVPSDSPSDSVYKFLIVELINKINRQELL